MLGKHADSFQSMQIVFLITFYPLAFLGAEQQLTAYVGRTQAAFTAFVGRAVNAALPLQEPAQGDAVPPAPGPPRPDGESPKAHTGPPKACRVCQSPSSAFSAFA